MVSGTNNNNAGTDVVSIDNLVINVTNPGLNTGVDILNGGLGDDTYSFSLGDGNDTSTKASARPVAARRIEYRSPAPITGIDPVTGLPITTLTGLNANDSNTGTQTGDLVINYSLPNGAKLRGADDHGGRTFHRHQRPDRRRADQLQRRHICGLSARRG